MPIEVSDLILVAIFTGVGSGIGNPIGQAIYKRFIEKPFKNIDKLNSEALRREYTDSLKLLDAVTAVRTKIKKAGEEAELHGGSL